MLIKKHDDNNYLKHSNSIICNNIYKNYINNLKIISLTALHVIYEIKFLICF